MGWYAGADLGATNIRAVVGDEAGTVHGRDRRRTPSGADSQAVTDTVVTSVAAAAEAAGVAPSDIVACGVGSVGPLDPEVGGVGDSPNLADGIEQVPLVEPLTTRFEAPVTLHNDADAGLIGERFYAANPPENMAYLTISTGIGAGVAVDGEVLSGVEGNAAEVGHFVVEPGGLFCGCGGEGHWEAYCAGTSIPQHARSLHESEGIQSNLSLDVAEFRAADVFAAVGEDPLADRTVEACTRYNAIGVANIVHAFAPETIYVGGAVARNNAELVVDPLQERVADRVMTTAPEIRVTSLGDETVVRGALAAAIIAATEDRTLAD